MYGERESVLPQSRSSSGPLGQWSQYIDGNRRFSSNLLLPVGLVYDDIVDQILKSALSIMACFTTGALQCLLHPKAPVVWLYWSIMIYLAPRRCFVRTRSSLVRSPSQSDLEQCKDTVDTGL